VRAGILLPVPPADELRRRVPVVLAGLVLFGIGIGLMVRAELGLAPWDVLHQGISDRTGLPMGTVTILTGVTVLLGWIPLRQRLGLGTVLNALVIGVVVDATLALVDAPETMPVRIALLVVGVFLFGPGSGLYIGAGLGPGPRDGLMTGLSRGGRSVRVVRTGIELSVLAVGVLLGGSAGVGTILFAATVGPNVHLFLEVMGMPPPRSRGECEGGSRPPLPRRIRLRRS